MRGGYAVAIRSQIHVTEKIGQLEPMKLLRLVRFPKQQESAATAARCAAQERLVVKHDAPSGAFDTFGNVRLYQLL
jgi:hypothetical protein